MGSKTMFHQLKYFTQKGCLNLKPQNYMETFESPYYHFLLVITHPTFGSKSFRPSCLFSYVHSHWWRNTCLRNQLCYYIKRAFKIIMMHSTCDDVFNMTLFGVCFCSFGTSWVLFFSWD